MDGISEELILQIKAQTQQFLADMKKATKAVQDFHKEADKGKKGDNAYTQQAKQIKELTALVKKLQLEIKNLNKEQSKGGGGKNNLSKDLNSMIAGWGKFASAAYLAAQAIRVVAREVERGIKFNMMVESQESMFKVLLKDGAMAKKMISDIRDLTLKTPIAFDQAADSAKQLMAYGFEAGELVSNLKMLGTVASATGGRLDDIAYVYGTLRTQGRAYSRDLMQFAMRGIPIYEELAKVVGKPVQEIKTLTEAGQIGFKEVETAFRNMTNQGGIYSGALEAKMDTLAGKTEILGKKWEMLMGTMASSMEPVLKGLTDIATRLVEGASGVITDANKGKKLAELNNTFLSGTNQTAKDLYQTFDADYWMGPGGLKSEEKFVGAAGLGSLQILENTAKNVGMTFDELADTLIAFKKSGEDSADSVKEYSQETGLELKSVTDVLARFGLITQETAEALKQLGKTAGYSVSGSAVDFLSSLGVSGSSYATQAMGSRARELYQVDTASRLKVSPDVKIFTELVKDMTSVGQQYGQYRANLEYYESGAGKNESRADEMISFYRGAMTSIAEENNNKITGIIKNIIDAAARGDAVLGKGSNWQKIIDTIETYIIDTTKPSSGSGSATNSASQTVVKEIALMASDLYDELMASFSTSTLDDTHLEMVKQLSQVTNEYQALLDNAYELELDASYINQLKTEEKELRKRILNHYSKIEALEKDRQSFIVPKELSIMALETQRMKYGNSYDQTIKEELARFALEEEKLIQRLAELQKDLMPGDMLSAQDEINLAEHRTKMANIKAEHEEKMKNLAMERAFNGSANQQGAKDIMFKYGQELLGMFQSGNFSGVGNSATQFGKGVAGMAMNGSQFQATAFGGANPLLQIGVAFADAMQSVESFAKIMNWAQTVVESMFKIIGPILEAVFLPFANTLEFIGEAIGALLSPFATLAAIITSFTYLFQVVLMVPLQILGNAFKIVADTMINWFLNPLIDGINGFINAINKAFGWAGVNIKYLKRLATSADQAAEALEEISLDKSKNALSDTINYLNDKLRDLADRGIKSAQDLWEVGAVTATEYEQRIAEANKFVKAEDEKNVLGAALGENDPGKLYAMLQASYEMEKILNEGILIEISEMNAILTHIASVPSDIPTVVGAITATNAALATLPTDIVNAYMEATGQSVKVDAPNAPSSEQAKDAGGNTGGALAGAATGAAVGATVGAVLGPVGAAVGGIVGGLGGAIKGFFGWDVGSPNISADHMAMVHKGETIIPTTFADAIRKGDLSLHGPGTSSNAQGGVTVVVNVNGSVTTEQELTKIIAERMYTMRRGGMLTV